MSFERGCVSVNGGTGGETKRTEPCSVQHGDDARRHTPAGSGTLPSGSRIGLRLFRFPQRSPSAIRRPAIRHSPNRFYRLSGRVRGKRKDHADCTPMRKSQLLFWGTWQPSWPPPALPRTRTV